MTHGRFVGWKKGEGEAYAEGEDIAEVESDKATMPIEAREDGFIARIFVEPDTPDLPLGTLLAITVEEEGDIAAFKDYIPASSGSVESSASDASESAASADIAPAAAVSSSPPTTAPTGAAYDGPIGPAVARLLGMYPNIDLNKVTASGPQNRILKGDVLAAIEDGSAFGDAPGTAAKKSSSKAKSPVKEPVPTERKPSFTDVPVSQERVALAARAVESKQQVPHHYGEVTFELDQLEALRDSMNISPESPDVTVTDFIIRSVAIALQRVPEMNVRYYPVSDEAVQNGAIDIAMTVPFPGGVSSPVLRNVGVMGLTGIARTTQDLTARVQERTITPEEQLGGYFSVSNLGMYGVNKLTSILSPDQTAIIGVGGGSKFIIFSCSSFCNEKQFSNQRI